MIAERVSKSKVKELLEESVVLSSNDDVNDWSVARDALQSVLDLDYSPSIIVITRRRALAELLSAEDQAKALLLSEFKLESTAFLFCVGC